jgi:hypothetical protein
MNEVLTAPPEQSQLVQIDKRISEGMKAFETRKAELIELKAQATGLDITSIDDKAAIAEVSTIRKKLKAARVEIEKEGKSMRDPLTRIAKEVKAKEDELVAIIEPTEKELLAKEQWVDAERARIEQEELQARIDQLAKFGYKLDLSVLKTLSAEGFNSMLEHAQTEWKKEQELKALQEKERLAAEQKAEAERKELAELRRKQAEQERIIAEQQRAIVEARMKTRQNELTALGMTYNGRYMCYAFEDVNVDVATEIMMLEDAEWKSLLDKVSSLIEDRKKAAEEKAALEVRTKNRSSQVIALGMTFHLQSGSFVFQDSSVSQETIERVVDAEFEEILSDLSRDIEASKKALEQKRIAEIEKAKLDAADKALREKAEADERAKIAEADRVAQLSDSAKYREIYNRISDLGFPEMKSQKGKKVLIHLEGMKNQMLEFVKPLVK